MMPPAHVPVHGGPCQGIPPGGRGARRRGMAALALAALLAAGPALAQRAEPPADGQQPAGRDNPMRTAPASFSALAKDKLPAVVTITAAGEIPAQAPGEMPGGPGAPPFGLPPGSPLEDFFGEFFGRRGPDGGGPRPTRALGSGFVIDPAGFIVTNNHVVENADEIEVAFPSGDTYQAKLIGTDPATDIALLKVETPEPLPALAWGDSETAEVGDWVIAIGNPFGLGGTVTAGIISARARDIGAGNYDDFLQTDTAINTGNSGGPLIDMKGEVIGVNTAIFSRSGGNIGIGFSVPSAIARSVAEELRDRGFVERGFLGVTIQQVSPEIAAALGLKEARGALVSSVTADSPAAQAGIETGDLITTLNGRPVERPRDLSRAVADTDPGRTVELGLLRQGRERTVTPKVGTLPRERQVAEAETGGESGQATLGLTLAPLTPPLRERFGLEEDTQGTVVVGVAPNSPAAQRGFQPGDLITRANQSEVTSPEDLQQAIAEARKQGRDAIVVLRRSQDGALFVPLPVSPRQTG